MGGWKDGGGDGARNRSGVECVSKGLGMLGAVTHWAGRYYAALNGVGLVVLRITEWGLPVRRCARRQGMRRVASGATLRKHRLHRIALTH